jgi:chemotaxis signal transduction protein
MKEAEEMKAEAAPRALLLLRAGGLTFAVEAEEAEAVAEAPDPVPLPHAPATVLGVVCVRGRMYTLLDTHALLAATLEGVQAEEVRAASVRFAVTLRGDEQLALAADEVEGPLEVQASSLEPSDTSPPLLRARFERGGARAYLLDPAGLFDAAMQGTERRRQRT